MLELLQIMLEVCQAPPSQYLPEKIFIFMVVGLTWDCPWVLILVLVGLPVSVSAGVVLLLLDGIVVLDPEEDGVLPPLGAVLLEVHHRHGLLVVVLGHLVLLG